MPFELVSLKEAMKSFQDSFLGICSKCCGRAPNWSWRSLLGVAVNPCLQAKNLAPRRNLWVKSAKTSCF